MQLSMKCSVAIHCLIFIHEARDVAKVTSTLLSQSTGVNPVVIRNILSALKKAGLISVTRGTGGAELCREPEQITLYQVYSALEQAFEEKTMAKLRQIENETDRAVKGLTGRDLQEKLEEANQKMADLTYKQTVALTGEMVKDGHTLMKLKYDLLD